jgi:hypothetical protein
VVQKTSVKIRNTGTNLVVTAESKDDGSFSAADLPIGTYEVTFTKDGFKTVVYSAILIQGNHTTTVDAKLEPGSVSTSVTVESTPLLNETDTSNGYTLGRDVIQSTPLGTGSFTQLAILAPGTSADFLSGSGSNEGLGNQGIVANGQRDTSNSFTFNSVNANNLFNGNSTSNIADSRFTLNTGEVFGTSGQVQTSTSVYDAIGQGLPTPPVETIQELQVTTSMFDASMGQNSGAHIELTTISGANAFHGQGYGYLQNSGLDAKPTFLADAITQNLYNGNAPPLHRSVFGGTLGGPILKDKLFFFGSYQRQNVSDALSGGFSGVPTLPGLTASNRDAADLANLINFDAGLTGGVLGGPCTNGKVKCVTAAQADPVALKIFSAQSAGQFIIPSAGGAAISTESSNQEYNAGIRGLASTFKANQVNGNVDYNFNSSDRIAAKYYFQRNPTSAPFAVSQTVGFPQSLQAGSQVFSLDNTTVLTPNTTWEQRFGFIREIANASTAQPFGPSAVGLSLPSGDLFPGIDIENADVGACVGQPPCLAPGTAGADVVKPLAGNEQKIGPSSNFANAGIFQNQFEGSSKYIWVLGKHTMAFGVDYGYTQLNVENRENDAAILTFRDFEDFYTGTLGADKSSGTLLDGETNRHFRSRQAGLFAQDSFKLRPNLTVTYGLRWDWDGPLYETNGLMTSFYPKDYNYDLATDTFNPINGTPGIGIVVPDNNKTFGVKGVSNSTMTGRQWGFAPRIGVAWSPMKNFVVRAGYGMFYDRGEYFTELSASAGLGISGPFSVTTQEPFTIPLTADCGAASPTCSSGCSTSALCLSSSPFGTTLPATPTSLADLVTSELVPNMRQISACNQATAPGLQQPLMPYCNVNSGTTKFPFLFGGYDPANKLPYSENWSLDFQWQPRNDLVLTLGYVGNHGVHEVLPIPFNQPGLATQANPINNQIYSYGEQGIGGPPNGCDSFFDPSPTCLMLPDEEVQTQIGEFSFADGNTALRSKFIGINPNADLWEAEGISSYNALQLGLTKKISHGLQINASYTYSHTLDEGSGLGGGLFFNGNNPANPRSSYASADFDRPHVFIVSYVYTLPTIKDASRLVDAVANGWGITGVTTAQSGEPFSVIDFTGVAGDIFFSGDNFVTNPILPLAPGITPQEAMSAAGGGGTQVNGFIPGTNPKQRGNNPFVNPNSFAQPLIAPGVDGVPPCQIINTFNVCDNFETGFGATGRNAFRAPFETLFNFSVFKNFKINERFNLKYQFDAFNLFNHPSLDAPNTDFELNACFSPEPCPNFKPNPPNNRGWGVISSTIGGSRFLQMSLHLTF